MFVRICLSTANDHLSVAWHQPLRADQHCADVVHHFGLKNGNLLRTGLDASGNWARGYAPFTWRNLWHLPHLQHLLQSEVPSVRCTLTLDAAVNHLQ